MTKSTRDTASPEGSSRRRQGDVHRHGRTNDDFMEDIAESYLVSELEERRNRAGSARSRGGGGGWSRAVEGEEPPFGERQVDFDDDHDTGNVREQESESRRARQRQLWSLVRSMRALNATEEGASNPPHHQQGARLTQVVEQLKECETTEKVSPTPSKRKKPRHKRAQTVPSSTAMTGGQTTPFFEGVGVETIGSIGTSQVALEDTDADRLITGAWAVDRLLKERDDEDASTVVSNMSTEASLRNEETLPLTSSSGQGLQHRSFWFPFFSYGSVSAAGGSAARRKKKKRRRCRRRLERWFRRGGFLAQACRPFSSVSGFSRLILTSWTFMISIPAMVAAFIFYYWLGHPELDFLPGQASISWWCIFASRQAIMLDFARMTQWFLVDLLALHSRMVVSFLGPLVTLLVLQASGWPFLIISWSLWDLCFLHGDNPFNQNWFHHWEHLAIFGSANMKGGNEVLASETYLRILLAMLFAGSATAIKRTKVALYFGRRTFVTYKPSLEKLLADIVVITEVAELAAEAQYVTTKALPPEQKSMTLKENLRKAKMAKKWESMKFESLPRGATPNITEDDDEEEGGQEPANDNIDDEDLTSDEDEEDDEEDDEDESEEDEEEDGQEEDAEGSGNSTAPNAPRKLVSSNVSSGTGTTRIKSLLDRWEEPVNKVDKTLDASIHDVLKFRKALTYLDEEQPFSYSFGPASTRDQCIKSSQKVYRRLMKLANGRGAVPFEVIRILALDNDGEEIESKAKNLRRIFRPDVDDEISLLAFVHTCDTVYKRLRYFRASVGNSSVIDKVLQNIVDALFFFLLALLILSLLNINPWKFLVSITTLVVSFAFALGPSTSRIIEGILLITRRPFDLGDRVVIVGSENVVNYGAQYSWFVEDINLFNTTLRFANTNEVAVVSNGAISQSRIVNCSRSDLALVTLELQFLASNATEEKLDMFLKSIKEFLRDRPRQWDSLAFFRCDEIDTSNEFYLYRLRARHVRSWQDCPVVLMSRSELLKYCYEITKQLDMVYDTPVPGRRLYFAGEWRDADYSQIRNRHDDDFGIKLSHEHRAGSTQRLSPSMTKRSGSSRKSFSSEEKEGTTSAAKALSMMEKK